MYVNVPWLYTACLACPIFDFGGYHLLAGSGLCGMNDVNRDDPCSSLLSRTRMCYLYDWVEIVTLQSVSLKLNEI